MTQRGAIEVPRDRWKAARGLLYPAAFIVVVTWVWLSEPDTAGLMFWIGVPLATIALAVQLLMVLVNRPRLRIDEQGIYLMPPGAGIAWADVADVDVFIPKWTLFQGKDASLGIVPAPGGKLRWDPVWSPGRLWVLWDRLRRQPPLSMDLGSNRANVDEMLGLIREFSGRPFGGPS